jgi:hypothetical protein
MTIRIPQLPGFNPPAKLIALVFALVVIGRSKVALFGWAIPLPVLFLAVELVAAATVISIVLILRRPGRAVTRTGAGS